MTAGKKKNRTNYSHTENKADTASYQRQRSIVDDPLSRQEATVFDLYSNNQESKPVSKLRDKALKHVRKMPALKVDGSFISNCEDNSYIAPISGASNWVQLGPTAVPRGQTYSQSKVLITGRVTAIVVIQLILILFMLAQRREVFGKLQMAEEIGYQHPTEQNHWQLEHLL